MTTVLISNPENINQDPLLNELDEHRPDFVFCLYLLPDDGDYAEVSGYEEALDVACARVENIEPMNADVVVVLQESTCPHMGDKLTAVGAKRAHVEHAPHVVVNTGGRSLALTILSCIDDALREI